MARDAVGIYVIGPNSSACSAELFSNVPNSICPRWSSDLSNEVGEVAMSLRAPNYGELASIDYSKPPRSMGLGCTMSGNACWVRSMVLSLGLTLNRLSCSVTCGVVFSKCLVSRSRLSRSAGSSIPRYLMPVGEMGYRLRSARVHPLG